MNIAEKKYRNIFKELGISDEEVNRKIEETFQTFFYGSEEERIYHPVGEDMGYLEDTGNNDARTEGMSYGMMICVQLNKKEEFDRIWKWAKTYMWMDKGYNEGYFAWSCKTNGKKNAEGPAPDGEEFFAMALFFASHRWGEGEGIYAYAAEARKILSACIHKGSNGRVGQPMWNHDNHQILFVPGSDFTDPSYHLPHFYDLFALWANEEDRPFFKKAAEESRKYLVKACHPVTGLCAEYAEFDGTPFTRKLPWTNFRHDLFYSDAYRTAANIGLDAVWSGEDYGQYEAADKLLNFFGDAYQAEFGIYEIDGTRVEGEALHPIGLLATNAQAALACKTDVYVSWVKRFFETPLRQGKRRYYDNCLYFFALLALSGNYRIW